ncbi:MAG: hypothetical protein LAP61_05505 [Acidobacteriia bacterium]|nr:hypothetical protein [Terriglobia bacterium]
MIASNGRWEIGEVIVFGDEPPLGPMGRKSHRGVMYRHNRRIAVKRSKEKP